MAGSNKTRDWTKTGTIVALAEWIQKSGGALAGVVIRVDDAALAIDPELMPKDVQELLNDRLPDLIKNMAAARLEMKNAARLEMPVWRD